MYGKYKLNDIVCLDNNIREFLKFKSTEIKMAVLLNYILCNYCKHKELFSNDTTSIFSCQMLENQVRKPGLKIRHRLQGPRWIQHFQGLGTALSFPLLC